MTSEPAIRSKADHAFSQARRRAFLQRVRRFLSRHHDDHLLSFDQVRDKLRIRGQHYAGIQTVPLDKIVGSTGRYHEFNRAFLPTQDFIRERWKRVYQAAHEGGFPPIEVYKIGDAYFVRDGHHRVSVLKDLGATSIEAAVTELDTPIPLSADVDEAELEMKAEYARFLQDTALDQSRPEQNIELTLPGQYQKLREHIAVHRYFLGQREQREIPLQEAAAHWYDEVYLPVVQVIREADILKHFPGRTEADLYLWLVEHRHYLSQEYGHEVPLAEAAARFSQEYSQGAGKKQLEAGIKRDRDAARARSKKSLTVAVYGSGSVPVDHPLMDEAEVLGRLLAKAGFTVMCGGYGGTMEAVSRGASQAGGQVIGVTMDLFERKPNLWLTREQRVKDFFPRLKRLTSADGFVVLSGGIGTLTEATLTWSLLQTGQISTRPFVFVGDNWRRLFDAFRAETFMTEDDFALATVVDSPAEVLAALQRSLLPTP